MPSTLVFFHAHPDDEALLTAGTMAKAAADGHRVVLVVATAGEVGEAAEVYRGGDLGTTRLAELQRSASVLGVARLEVLGYGDSGSGDADAEASGLSGAGGPAAFAAVEVDEAAGRLAALLVEEGAQVLTTYDANGGYGHPDHLQVHAVGARAAALAGTPRVLEATINRDLMSMGVELARSLGYEIPETFAPTSFDGWFTPGDEITHAIDVSAHLAAKRASMEAHASQATSGDGSTRTLAAFLALPDEYFAMAFGTEWYRDPAAPAGAGIDDVLAGLEESTS